MPLEASYREHVFAESGVPEPSPKKPKLLDRFSQDSRRRPRPGLSSRLLWGRVTFARPYMMLAVPTVVRYSVAERKLGVWTRRLSRVGLASS